MGVVRPMMRLAFALALSCLAACGSTPATPTQPSPAPAASALSTAASAYLTSIIDIAQRNSINRLTIDWTAYRTSVFDTAGSAQSIAELNPAIRTAITLLRDGHSSYRSASGTTIFVPLRSCAPPALVPLSLPANIGSVRVGAFSGTPEQATAYARQIQDAIAAADRDDLLGWIVDLRSNGGGNMWPMIAGLGPILGDGPLGYFIGPTGAETLWEYRDGASRSGGTAITTVSAPYVLKRQRPRVAVLSDVGIASSGEATLIAFRQRRGHAVVRPADLRPLDGERDVPVERRRDVHDHHLGDGGSRQDPLRRFDSSGRNHQRSTQAIQRAVEWLQTGR